MITIGNFSSLLLLQKSLKCLILLTLIVPPCTRLTVVLHCCVFDSDADVFAFFVGCLLSLPSVCFNSINEGCLFDGAGHVVGL